MKKFNSNTLVAARNLKGISQIDLANKARISQGYLSKIECGLEPSDDVAESLAFFLGFEKDFFYSDFENLRYVEILSSIIYGDSKKWKSKKNWRKKFREWLLNASLEVCKK